MSRGVNKAIVIGTLGQDPELRHGSSGVAILNISVATNESWKDKNTGEQKELTEWHRIVMFGKLAEIGAEYLHKGSQAYFEGRLQTRKWQDKNGQDRYSTEIVAHEMQMLGPKPESEATAKPAQEAPQQGDGFDDIPF